MFLVLWQNLQEIQEDHQTRHSNQMYIERCNSTFAGKFPLYKLYQIGGVISSQMLPQEAISRNN